MSIDLRLNSFFYTSRRGNDITIDQFRDLCLKRVNLLRDISTSMDSSLTEDITMLIKKKIDDVFNTNVYDDRDQKNLINDNISHFLLRLCYCRTEELRKWFVKQESRILKVRLNGQPINTVLNVSEQHIPQYLPLPESVFLEKKKQIISSTSYHIKDFNNRQYITSKQLDQNPINHHEFVQVRYQLIPSIVADNRCYLYKGVATIVKEDLKSIIINNFSENLMKELEKMSTMIEMVLTDKRIKDFIINLNDEDSLGNKYIDPKNIKRGKIKLADLDGLSQQSFPPCMRYLYENGKINSHLKHYGRQQLGLFLKGAGLVYEEAIMFWRKFFSQKTTADDFEKKYSYNIRHNYGREGKKTDYTPSGCSSVIKMLPGSDDNTLKKFLEKYRMSSEQLQTILNKKKGHHYQVGCRLTFEYTHPEVSLELLNTVGNHPNAYFDASIKYLQSKKEDPEKE